MVGVVLVHRKNILGNLARRQSYAFVTLAHHLVIWNGRPGESCSKCISTIEVVWLLQVYFGFCAGSWACPSSLSFLYSNRTGGKWKQIWCFLSSGDLHHIIKHHQTLNTQNRWRSHFVVSLKVPEALIFWSFWPPINSQVVRFVGDLLGEHQGLAPATTVCCQAWDIETNGIRAYGGATNVFKGNQFGKADTVDAGWKRLEVESEFRWPKLAPSVFFRVAGKVTSSFLAWSCFWRGAWGLLCRTKPIHVDVEPPGP